MYCNPFMEPPRPTLTHSTFLQAKDQGRQFIVAVSDPAFPFAADAELVIPCPRVLWTHAAAGFRISCATKSIFHR